MTKFQKETIEEYLTNLCNYAKGAKEYSIIAKTNMQFETARHILTTLGYGGYFCKEENKYVLYKLS